MMTRPKWKEIFYNPNLIKKSSNSQLKLKTWYRHSNIPKYLIGRRLKVHNGHRFIDVNIIPRMVGHKLGEFANTRRPCIFKKKKEKKKEKKK
jgi:small subunit ribosomal protein S19